MREFATRQLAGILAGLPSFACLKVVVSGDLSQIAANTIAQALSVRNRDLMIAVSTFHPSLIHLLSFPGCEVAPTVHRLKAGIPFRWRKMVAEL